MLRVLSLAALLLLSSCAGKGDISADASGIGVSSTRTACPAVGVPIQTGDITLFDPPASRDARAIDVVATLTNVRSTCGDLNDDVVANATFDVEARRTHTEGARDVTLPYFATIVRGGNVVVAKRISQVVVHFDAGQARASGHGQGGAVINRAAATLPPEVLDRLRRKRKASDADASIDPMAAPDVRAALGRASFELLVGFQLTAEQLQYNATR